MSYKRNSTYPTCCQEMVWGKIQGWSDRSSAACVVNTTTKVLSRGRVRTCPQHELSSTGRSPVPLSSHVLHNGNRYIRIISPKTMYHHTIERSIP